MKDLLTLREAEEKLSEIRNYVKWWENKRLWFNLAVFVAGVVPFLIHGNILNLFSLILIPIGFYAVAINVCYCAGWGLGILIWNYTAHIKNIARANWFFFLIGTGFSTLFTFVGSYSISEFM